MKNYDETINSVFEKIDEYNIEKKRRHRAFTQVAASLCLFCAISLAVIGLFKHVLLEKAPTADVSSIGASKTESEAIDSIGQSSVGVSSEAISSHGTDRVLDFSSRSLDEWLADTSVIWEKGDALKGSITPEIPLETGRVLVTERLADKFSRNSKETVYAVMVFFDPMPDVEIEGKRVSEWNKLKMELIDQGKNVEAKQIARKIYDANEAYYNGQIIEFEKKFSAFGLGVYREKYGVTVDSCIFYTFATKGQIENINCDPDEALVLTSAVRFK